MIAFGRDICSNYEQASSREWLVTNGIGGYASGTIAGVLTRSYHGMLVAALKPPLGRTLLLAKLDETAEYDGVQYPLFCNRWATGVIEQAGLSYLESFRLDGSLPVWTYALGEVLLQKRLWMRPGENSSVISYTYLRPPARKRSQPARRLGLQINLLANQRDHHAVTHASSAPQFEIHALPSGVRISDTMGKSVMDLNWTPDSPAALFTPENQWYMDFYLSLEAYRGLEAVEDHFHAGMIEAELNPGDSLTLVARAIQYEGDPGQNEILSADDLIQEYNKHQKSVFPSAGINPKDKVKSLSEGDTSHAAAIRQLILAADQFIVRRASQIEPQGNSIIAGYHWFGDWGRDTMIALPGLTLATGRTQIARRILRTFASFADQGMLPNRFPDAGEAPEYNTADATLWYFQALRVYYHASGDRSLLSELYPILSEIIDWHLRGTRFQIRCDPQDGLLYAGQEGTQLTWMDAKVDDWVVTPRIGKPVEINALWYNALCSMAEFSGELGHETTFYRKAAEKASAGFARFWNPERGFLYDVLDGPQGNDPALRPNQLFAVSLPYSALDEAQMRAIVDISAWQLLTSYGLRSLGPDEPGYTGHYGGDRHQRDAAYHQGTVWGWLIGPFVSAHLRVYRDPALALSFLEPLLQHLNDHGLGTISEIFDGDPPFTPRGCIAQAWSVAEVLRAWREISQVEHNLE